MTIRVVYSEEPNFPATDQSPDCLRATVGNYVVDYVGTLPTLDEVTSFLNPQPIGQTKAVLLSRMSDAIAANDQKTVNECLASLLAL